MPRRTSEKEKKLKGNPGKRPLKQDAPAFSPAEDLTPPTTLREDAIYYWEASAKELKDRGLLQRPDIPLLVSYCNAMDIRDKCLIEIATHGIVEQASPNVPAYVNPHFKAMQAAEKLALSIGNKFGLTPGSRSALKIEQPKAAKASKLLMMRERALYGPQSIQ